MTLYAGNTDYTITITTSLDTTTAGSETPGTTHYIKLFAESYEISLANLIKPRPTIAAAVYVASSKHDINITLKNVTVTPQSSTTALQEANAIDHFLYTYSIKRGSTPLYLFIQHAAESATEDGYRKLDWNSGGTHIRPLRCAVEGWPCKSTAGKLIIYTSIKFNKAA